MTTLDTTAGADQTRATNAPSDALSSSLHLTLRKLYDFVKRISTQEATCFFCEVVTESHCCIPNRTVTNCLNSTVIELPGESNDTHELRNTTTNFLNGSNV